MKLRKVKIEIPIDKFCDMIAKMDGMIGRTSFDIADVAYTTLTAYMSPTDYSDIVQYNLLRQFEDELEILEETEDE